MHWGRIPEYIEDAFSLALIVRLLILRLHSVYRVFCLFLIWELLASAITSFVAVDYRIAWMATRPLSWVLSLWMVYALLGALLTAFPGILKLSRRVLDFTFFLALIIAVSTARGEYLASGLSGSPDAVVRALGVTFVLERVISMAAVLLLLAILGFILWFPVRMPRNLAIFSIGYIVYFAAQTSLLLARTYWAPGSVNLLSAILNLVFSGCFAYLTIFISQEGEAAAVRVGHGWHVAKQERLIGQLEAMNTALLRSARR